MGVKIHLNFLLFMDIRRQNVFISIEYQKQHFIFEGSLKDESITFYKS